MSKWGQVLGNGAAALGSVVVPGAAGAIYFTAKALEGIDLADPNLLDQIREG